VILEGQVVKVGGVESLTVTVKEHVAVFPARSVALNVMVVTPKGKRVSLRSPAIRRVVTPAQLSVPTGVAYVTVEVHALVGVFTDVSLGQLIAGGIVSIEMITSSEDAVQGSLVTVQRSL
jgi:hypothetical protein